MRFPRKLRVSKKQVSRKQTPPTWASAQIAGQPMGPLQPPLPSHKESMNPLRKSLRILTDLLKKVILTHIVDHDISKKLENLKIHIVDHDISKKLEHLGNHIVDHDISRNLQNLENSYRGSRCKQK